MHCIAAFAFRKYLLVICDIIAIIVACGVKGPFLFFKKLYKMIYSISREVCFSNYYCVILFLLLLLLLLSLLLLLLLLLSLLLLLFLLLSIISSEFTYNTSQNLISIVNHFDMVVQQLLIRFISRESKNFAIFCPRL